MPNDIRGRRSRPAVPGQIGKSFMVIPVILVAVVALFFLGRFLLADAGVDQQELAWTATHDAFMVHISMLTAGVVSTPFEGTTIPVTSTSPAATIIPTRRPTLTLDVPIGPEGLIIHQVTEGDTLDLLARKNGTSVLAIQTVNASLRVPLWVGWLVVIPADRTDVEALPGFDAYRVIDFIRLEDLAKQLGVDMGQLQYYNDLADGVILSPNEYVLVPSIPPCTSTPTP